MNYVFEVGSFVFWQWREEHSHSAFVWMEVTELSSLVCLLGYLNPPRPTQLKRMERVLSFYLNWCGQPPLVSEPGKNVFSTT